MVKKVVILAKIPPGESFWPKITKRFLAIWSAQMSYRADFFTILNHFQFSTLYTPHVGGFESSFYEKSRKNHFLMGKFQKKSEKKNFAEKGRMVFCAPKTCSETPREVLPQRSFSQKIYFSTIFLTSKFRFFKIYPNDPPPTTQNWNLRETTMKYRKSV